MSKTSSQWITEATDPAEWWCRVLELSAPAGQCREWLGGLDRYGYGRFRFISTDGRRRMTGAHRAAWLASRGPIPRGLVIDHLCRNRACVDVDHMEVVTVRVNTQRGSHRGRAKGRGILRIRDRCRNGHELAPANTYIRETKLGSRVMACRECNRNRRRAHYERQRTA